MKVTEREVTQKTYVVEMNDAERNALINALNIVSKLFSMGCPYVISNLYESLRNTKPE